MTSRSPFTPIARQSLTDQVRRGLEQRIRDGGFAPGAQLPSEHGLCAEFGVSRPSIREAIRELMALGLVERRGNRAHVVEHLPDVQIEVAERVDRVRELFETRRAIEVPLTEYAAVRATPAQRDQLATLAQRIRAVDDLDQLRPLDQAFHALIAEASGNSLLAELHAKVLDALFSSPRFDEVMSADHDHDDTSRIVAETTKAHLAIAIAVIRGDGEKAAGVARRHLDDVERRMVAQSRLASAPRSGAGSLPIASP